MKVIGLGSGDILVNLVVIPAEAAYYTIFKQ
jgi:hypothetical protein